MTAKPFDKRPFLLLCEGNSDKWFFDQLIKRRGIEDAFQVYFPGRDGDTRQRAGRSRFGAWLDVAADAEEFIDNVKAVLVVSDNDDDPDKSLGEVKASLKSATAFKVPDKEREIAKSADAPPLAILMVPSGSEGNLETLCLSAAYKKWPLKTAIDAFTLATDAKGWSVGKQSKMRLQSIIAATCAPHPDAGFAGHWREKEEFHVPLDDVAFDDIVNFLKSFRKLIDDFNAYAEAVASAARSA